MIKTILLNSVAYPVAFAPGAGWKLDADGKIEMKDGNPIYVDESGREGTIERDTIARLNGEAKTHREAKEAAERKLAAFGNLDPAVATKAVETVSKLDAKKLIDAGEVDKVKEQIKGEFTTQITERDNKLVQMQRDLDGMRLSTAFKSSKFIAEKVAVPAEMFEATFGRHFKVEDGKVVPYGADGNKILSSKRIGEIADIDEAFEKIVDAYPYKDAILKAPNANGTGNNGGGGGRGAGRVIRREDWAKLNPNEQKTIVDSVAKGEAQLVD